MLMGLRLAALRAAGAPLLSDLHSTLDGNLVHRKLLLQHLITTTIHPRILFDTLLPGVHISFVTHLVLLFFTIVQLRNEVFSLL